MRKWLGMTVWLAAMAQSLLTGAAAEAGPRCGDLSSQTAMNMCFGNEFQRSDALLQRDYEELMRRLREDSGAKSLLRQAERAWISFRNAHCAFEAHGAEGGSAQPMVRATCLRTLTEARRAQIRQQLECTEGDLACLAPR